ncbi:acyltransferase, partial [Pseudomonadales bacterium]|nr:acyltransferase [Pseudomonadales bacterium]
GLGVALIIIPFFLYSSNTRHPSLFTSIPVLGVVLAIAYAHADSWAIRLLKQKAIVGIGLISYSLYLWHYPVFVFAKRLIDTPSKTSAIFLIALCMSLSITSFIFVEKPTRDVQVMPFSRLVIIVLISLAILVPVLLYVTKDGLRNRYPEFLLVQEAMPPVLGNYEWMGSENHSYGRVVLVGDSHMMAVAPELKDLALVEGFEFSVSNERGCQLIMDTRRVVRATGQPTHCTEALQRERLDFLRQSPPSFVVLGGRLPLILEEKGFNNNLGGKEKRMRFYIQNPTASLTDIQQRRANIRQKYRETVEAILAMGHAVVLVYPIPEAGWHIPKKLIALVEGDWVQAKRIAKANPIQTDYKVFEARSKRAYELLDEIEGDSLLRVYPEELFCNQEEQGFCATHDEEHVYYRDEHHPSAHGAELIAQHIMATILECGPDTDQKENGLIPC